MTLKEKIENNLTLYTLGLLLAGFLAGIGTYKFLIDLNAPSSKMESECKPEAWQSLARKDQWMPRNECPAFALDARITSPGDNSSIDFDSNLDTTLKTPLIISVNHPLTENADVGIVVKPSGEDNFYVIFPNFEEAQKRITFRSISSISIPFKLRSNTTLDVRALIVDDKKRIGSQFANIEQIKKSDNSVFIGDSITLKIR